MTTFKPKSSTILCVKWGWVYTEKASTKRLPAHTMPNSTNRLAKSTPTLFIKPKLGNSAIRLVKSTLPLFVEHDPAVHMPHKKARLAIVRRAVPITRLQLVYNGRKEMYEPSPSLIRYTHFSSRIAKLNNHVSAANN